MARSTTWRCEPRGEFLTTDEKSWKALSREYFRRHPLGDRCFIIILRYFGTERLFAAVRAEDQKPVGMLLLDSGRFAVVRSFRPPRMEVYPVLRDSVEELPPLFAALPRSTLAPLYSQDLAYIAFHSRDSSLVYEIDRHAAAVCIDLNDGIDEHRHKRPVKLQKNNDRNLRNPQAAGRHPRARSG